MTDIPNWLQAGAELAVAVISLGSAAAAWKAARHSGQAAEAMLDIEQSRRRDELDPIKNMSITFAKDEDATQTTIRMLARYAYDISFTSFSEVNDIVVNANPCIPASRKSIENLSGNFVYDTPMLNKTICISQQGMFTPDTISMLFRYGRFEWSYTFDVDFIRHDYRQRIV
jgi:hypothetical protein